MKWKNKYRCKTTKKIYLQLYLEPVSFVRQNYYWNQSSPYSTLRLDYVDFWRKKKKSKLIVCTAKGKKPFLFIHIQFNLSQRTSFVLLIQSERKKSATTIHSAKLCDAVVKFFFVFCFVLIYFFSSQFFAWSKKIGQTLVAKIRSMILDNGDELPGNDHINQTTKQFLKWTSNEFFFCNKHEWNHFIYTKLSN